MSNDSLCVFTCAARNYLPKVRALFRSLRKHHPEARLYLVLVDTPSERATDSLVADRLLYPRDLQIPKWKPWAFGHDLVELVTAVKPFAFRRILQEANGALRIIYLDPDVVVFSRLDDIIDALDTCNILLTPHLTDPEITLEGIVDNEICSLRHGIYNLGFLALIKSRESERFVDWWCARTYQFCRAHIEGGLFTDQKWIDFVPAFFNGVRILKNRRHNVAAWNLSQRTLEGDVGNGLMVDGQPLGFYHFTGFDRGDHRLMAMKYAPRRETVQSLLAWYGRQIEADEEEVMGNRWGFSVYKDGKPIESAHRLVYRLRPDLQERFPDPFDSSGFLAWFETRGRVEFSQLFDPVRRPGALAKLQSQLTPVFGAASQGPQLSKASRAWRLLRTEGIAAFVRRLATRHGNS